MLLTASLIHLITSRNLLKILHPITQLLVSSVPLGTKVRERHTTFVPENENISLTIRA